jgi:hypothetical protein
VVLGTGSGWVLAMFLMEFLDYLDLIGYMFAGLVLWAWFDQGPGRGE